MADPRAASTDLLVEHHTPCDLHTEGRSRAQRLHLGLRFHSRLPFAVTLTVGRVEWMFARELLHVGCDEPAGLGDVRVRPLPPDTADGSPVGGMSALPRPLLEITLAPAGQRPARLLVPELGVRGFLGRTEDLVPCGAESFHFAGGLEDLAARLRQPDLPAADDGS